MDMWEIPHMDELPEQLSVSRALLSEVDRGTGHGFIYGESVILNSDQHHKVQKKGASPHEFVIQKESKENFRDALEKIQFTGVHKVSLTKV